MYIIHKAHNTLGGCHQSCGGVLDKGLAASLLVSQGYKGSVKDVYLSRRNRLVPYFNTYWPVKM